jgi:serpin B
MSDAFGPSASFTRISDDPGVFLEDVLTAVMIEVDEAGTEAAAATAAVFATRSTKGPRKNEPIHMKCNRPFVFLLVHQSTRALLFAATVKNPGAVKSRGE